MDAEAIVAELHDRGVAISAAGDRIRLKPGSRVPAELVEDIRRHKAVILSFLVLPEEVRPLVTWATWLAEHPAHDEIEVQCHETPLRPVRLKLSKVGRYVARVLGALAMMQSAEVVGDYEAPPGWRREQIIELCSGLAALREALQPCGLAEIKER